MIFSTASLKKLVTRPRTFQFDTSHYTLRQKFKSWPADHFLNFTKSNFEDFYPERFKQEVKDAFSLPGDKKRKAKEKLILEVMEWALKNRDEAIVSFKPSASEVIELLRTLNKKLNVNKKRR